HWTSSSAGAAAHGHGRPNEAARGVPWSAPGARVFTETNRGRTPGPSSGSDVVSQDSDGSARDALAGQAAGTVHQPEAVPVLVELAEVLVDRQHVTVVLVDRTLVERVEVRARVAADHRVATGGGVAPGATGQESRGGENGQSRSGARHIDLPSFRSSDG